jgi:hypothetical protein
MPKVSDHLVRGAGLPDLVKFSRAPKLLEKGIVSQL